MARAAEQRRPPCGVSRQVWPQLLAKGMGLSSATKGETEIRLAARKYVVNVGRVLAVPHQVQAHRVHSLPQQPGLNVRT
ncbi:hypothetical protein GCM10009799_04790 [Nocardiopsis rhodophaea]|uniref:Uncharacterized protein n=1 Tax=Nocardiopsis rhodophaea TaxID=280238 RepID=A0ABN2S9F3_9ACTN